jgi:hypothetical protein
LLEKNIVSDKAQMRIVLPDGDKVVSAKIIVYDNVGNIVFETNSAKAVWDLRNYASREVANGTYLAVAEVKGISGKVYAYSAKVGVRK